MLLAGINAGKSYNLMQIFSTFIILHIFLSNKNPIKELWMPTLINVTNGQFGFKRLNEIIRMKVADTQVSY